jgi:hypothetical protein
LLNLSFGVPDQQGVNGELGADPYFHRFLPLDALFAHAPQATALENAAPGLREIALAVAKHWR